MVQWLHEQENGCDREVRSYEFRISLQAPAFWAKYITIYGRASEGSIHKGRKHFVGALHHTIRSAHAFSALRRHYQGAGQLSSGMALQVLPHRDAWDWPR